MGAGEDPCWGNTYNFAFRADVTALVTGNGTYSLSGFASGKVDGSDPWGTGSVAPMVEGASLVIVYENPTKPQTQILICDGSVETHSEVVTLSIDGFTAPSPVTQARTTFIGADGQDLSEPGSTFNGNFLPSVGWDGNDPQSGPAFSNGNLWDTMNVDVTTLVPPGSSSVTATVQGGGDCLVWVAQVFSVVTPAGLDVLDPNNLDTITSPMLLGNDGRITTDLDKLARAKEAWPLTGVVADGVTELLLRIEVDNATAQVTFSLPGGLKDGGLKAIGSAGPLVAALPVSVQTAAGKRWAFAVYTAPLNFSSTPTTQSDRDIRIVTQLGNSSGPDKSLKLERPPVILVHGVWSDDSAWSFLESYLISNGLQPENIYRVNYGRRTDCSNAKAAGSFDPFANEEQDKFVIRALIGKTDEALAGPRKKGVAVTQVDIVAHSMGGLVARARVKFADPPYYGSHSFGKGDFHKLITVGTPHHGSPFADHVVRYRGEKLTKNLFFCGSSTLEDWLTDVGRPLGPAIYGFQTSSTAIRNIGATPVPSHAIAGIEPGLSPTEIWLNSKLDNTCNSAARTKVDTLLGGEGNHDTIVPKQSQLGGLAGNAISVVNGIVHATDDCRYIGDTCVLPDYSETMSYDVWKEVLRLLRSSVDNQNFDLNGFPSFGGSDAYKWPGCTAQAAVPNTTALTKAEVSPDLELTLAPPPGTTVRPGETIQIQFDVTPRDSVTNGMFMLVGDHLYFTESNPPFNLSYTVPTNQAGRLRIFADAVYQWTNSYVQVLPANPPLSLRVSPDTVEFGYLGVPRALRVLGQYASGAELDLTSADTGTTYTILSDGNAVVTVSSNGVVEAKGDGQDTILVSNSGRSVYVIVTVKITNHAPAFDPLNDQSLNSGETRDLNVRVNDPDGNAIAISAAVLPSFAQFVDNGDGSGLLRLTPGLNDIGTNRASFVAVDDGDPNLGSSRTILITVAPPRQPCGSDRSVDEAGAKV